MISNLQCLSYTYDGACHTRGMQRRGFYGAGTAAHACTRLCVYESKLSSSSTLRLGSAGSAAAAALTLLACASAAEWPMAAVSMARGVALVLVATGPCPCTGTCCSSPAHVELIAAINARAMALLCTGLRGDGLRRVSGSQRTWVARSSACQALAALSGLHICLHVDPMSSIWPCGPMDRASPS